MIWQAVIVKATDDEVRAIATTAQQLLPSLANPIDVSVLSLRTPAVPMPWVVLRIVQFLSREIACAGPSDSVLTAFPQPSFQAGVGRSIIERVSRDPHVSLAVLASRAQGEATYLVARDGSCCSGHIRFQNGVFVSGVIYGWDGSDELWNLAPSEMSVRPIELGGPEDYNYYEPVATGLTQVLGPGADELFLSPVGAGTEGQWFRYQLMAQRQLISPVVGVPDPG
jgi:hypothetical protein